MKLTMKIEDAGHAEYQFLLKGRIYVSCSIQIYLDTKAEIKF